MGGTFASLHNLGAMNQSTLSTNTKGFMGSYELPRKGSHSDLTTSDTAHHDRTLTKAPKTSTCFDQIAPSLIAMKTKFATMHDQLDQLKKVDDSLSQFNDAFGAFLFGLSANGATTRWPCGFGPQDFEKHPIIHQQQVPKNEETLKETPVVKRRKFATKVSWDTPSNRQLTHLSFWKINIRKIIDRLPLKYREQTVGGDTRRGGGSYWCFFWDLGTYEDDGNGIAGLETET